MAGAHPRQQLLSGKPSALGAFGVWGQDPTGFNPSPPGLYRNVWDQSKHPPELIW